MGMVDPPTEPADEWHGNRHQHRAPVAPPRSRWRTCAAMPELGGAEDPLAEEPSKGKGHRVPAQMLDLKDATGEGAAVLGESNRPARRGPSISAARAPRGGRLAGANGLPADRTDPCRVRRGVELASQFVERVRNGGKIEADHSSLDVPKCPPDGSSPRPERQLRSVHRGTLQPRRHHPIRQPLFWRS
jgi:hypothetical protein